MHRYHGRVITMTLRVPDELDADLRAAAEAEGLSMNGFVLEAVREKLEARRHALVMETARGIIASDAAILDRLATA